jgi:hypothetical protein
MDDFPTSITPAYDTWTPCEDRADPSLWTDDVKDEPYPGDYHDPEADLDAVAH